MTNVHLTLKSGNRKVGPIPVSTTERATCPDACPLKGSGCYAEGGPLLIHWRKVSKGERGLSWGEFCRQVAAFPEGQLWRHNQAGDLPGKGDRLNARELAQLVAANRGRRGFTYTHKPLDTAGREAIRKANGAGFTVNLSANNLVDADRLADLGIGPVVTVLPADQMTNTATPAGRKVVVCPAVTRDDVSCASCKLCAIADRECVIGFPAHGSGKRKVEAIMKG